MQAYTSKHVLLVVVLVRTDRIRISPSMKLYGVKMDLIVLLVGHTLELIVCQTMSITQHSASIKMALQSKPMNAQRRVKDATSVIRNTSNVMLVRRVAPTVHWTVCRLATFLLKALEILFRAVAMNLYP